MTTRAVRDGDHYVISGTKYWITNAGISDFYTVFAKTDPAAGHRGISCFVVEKDWGVKVPKLEHKMGLRASPTGEVAFDEVHVPVENLVGEEGRGFYIAMHTLDRSRPTIGAQAVGIAQGALDYAAGYLKRRISSAGRLPTSRACSSWSPTWPCAWRRPAGSSTGPAHRSTPATRRGAVVDRGDGEVLRLRRRHAGGDRRRAVARRLRVHAGLPRRAVHARHQDHPDLRGNEPDPAHRHLEAVLR